MPRRLFTILAALSLVLCMVVVLLWVRSYYVIDQFGEWRQEIDGTKFIERSSGVFSDRGVVGWASGEQREELSSHPAFNIPLKASGWIDGLETFKPYMLLDDEPVFGFFTKLDQQGGGRLWEFERTCLMISYWLLALLFLVLPSFCVVMWMRESHLRKLVRRGLCPSCGYDLRATPDRCPECGHVPTLPKTTRMT